MEYIAGILLVALMLMQAIKIISNKAANKILELPIPPEEKVRTALKEHDRATAVYVAREAYKIPIKDAVNMVDKIERNENV